MHRCDLCRAPPFNLSLKSSVISLHVFIRLHLKFGGSNTVDLSKMILHAEVVESCKFRQSHPFELWMPFWCHLLPVPDSQSIILNHIIIPAQVYSHSYVIQTEKGRKGLRSLSVSPSCLSSSVSQTLSAPKTIAKTQPGDCLAHPCASDK